MAMLGIEAREQLAADCAHLDPVRLLSNAPRDERGRLVLGATMLLAPYDTIELPRPTYRTWLVASTPARRRDPQVVTISCSPMITENHPLRWNDARWLWDEWAAEAGEDLRWGVANLPIADLGIAGRDQQIMALYRRYGSDQAELRDRVALCILLQDAGLIEEALGLCDVALSSEVVASLRGATLGLDGGKLAAQWARFLQEQLRAAAPWRFGFVVAFEATRLRSWVAAKRGRRRRAPRLRLCALPHQTRQSKASLILAGIGPDHSLPFLEIEYTASNARLSEPLWRRPLDLARFGLL
jgi:hypothetical protein